MIPLLFLGMLLIVFFVSLEIKYSRLNSTSLVKFLKSQTETRHYLFSGLFLFGINAFLFGVTLLFLWLSILISIPYLHLIIILFAPLISIIIWFSLNNAWVGSAKERFKIGFIGSSFYLIISLVMIYQWLTLTPTYPNEDTFMISLGIGIAFIASTVAFFICLFIFSFKKPSDKTS